MIERLIVYSQGRIILGSYPASMLSEAQANAARIERHTGLMAYVMTIWCKPTSIPKVGQSVDLYK